MKVIELMSNTMVELSKQVWDTLPRPESYLNGVAFMDLITLTDDQIAQAKAEFPWVSGKVATLFLKPNSHAPIHVDNHDDGKYYRSLNILIESNNSNHKTFYYNYNGDWDTSEKGTIYGWDYDANDRNIERAFEMTVTHPTIFWNQQFHNTENYDGVERTLLMWEIHKDIDPADILKWLNEHDIKYNVLY
jgi:hypothetical protein